jgi:hypothetical protein
MFDCGGTGAVNKKAVAKVLSSLPGFRKLGSFYIGACNQEVISGYALDSPPGGVYVWRFILPAYDRIDFLHMSLGERIAQFPRNRDASDSTDLDVLLKNDWQDFSNARDCRSLMAYLDRKQVVGDYCQWTRYLTYARVGDLESAGRLELQWQSSPGSSPRLQLVAQSMKVVLEVKGRSGWSGVQELLTEWSKYTVTKFCQ